VRGAGGTAGAVTVTAALGRAVLVAALGRAVLVGAVDGGEGVGGAGVVGVAVRHTASGGAVVC
jgi:hypothetical protein